MTAMDHITPFSIQVEAEILSDLRERIRNTLDIAAFFAGL
jgi:hypothetical protein